MAREHSALDLRGRRVLVMGLGTRSGGLGVTRWLVHQGAEVTVTDLRTEAELRPSLEALRDLPVRLVLGEHRREDFERAEIVVRNPAVPRESPWLALARAAGARIEMEMTLFFRACPAPVIGVTGTKGKTTTATLCATILRQWRPETVLAGNLGRSALEALSTIRPDTPVVLELSSWQLEGLDEHGMSPHIALLTTISPDHLDRYPSFEAYVDAKRAIARHQAPTDWFVVNRDDPVAWACRDAGAGRIVSFGRDDGESEGAFWQGERLIWRFAGREEEILTRSAFPLAGDHAVSNALAAAAAALLRGAALEHVRDGLAAAQPVPHRLELVARIGDVEYVNDTAATAPAAVVAALETFQGRSIVLIGGGAAKGVSLAALARVVAARTRAVVLLDGTATPHYQAELQAAGAPVYGPYRSMEDAVRCAASLAVPGDVVLLSPGCASFGLFRDEFHRGEAFRDAVARLGVEKGAG
ncbi:MAG: UDP-N-acetylmuramoyl-L-alanine--D-glutamate ligase [Thermomicrobium sp.]|nr:UDP-N-acetylmuramoyl-L-alanine--D-glutamate ligase [Thermomicrobium sp.]